MKFVVRVKCCYSHYMIIKEKAAWGQIKKLLKTDFYHRRSRWSGSPLYMDDTNGSGLGDSLGSGGGKLAAVKQRGKMENFVSGFIERFPISDEKNEKIC